MNQLNEKLSYRRDDAHLRSLRLSRSFKVIDYVTNRKPVRVFILVHYIISRTIFQLLRNLSNYVFWQGGASV